MLQDLKTRLEKITDGDSDTVLKKNVNVVDRRFLLLLYARYVCLRAFLESAVAVDGGITEDHKQRWLLIQLASATLLQRSDIFSTLVQLAEGASYEFLEGAIMRLRFKIEKLTRSPLFCVLDEAQALIKNLDYFRSDAEPVKRQPILRPIIRGWSWILPNLIVSGTGISMQEVVTVIRPPVFIEGGNSVTVREIGGFDDEDGRRAYLKRYFPPGFLDTPEGIEIESRVGYWLRGRFVFAAV